MKEFLIRAPLALIGAFGLLSLTTNFMQFEGYLADSIAAYQLLSRSIWDLFFGWFWDLIGWRLMDPAQDYLTVGIIVFIASLRSFFLHDMVHYEPTKSLENFLVMPIITILAWPYVVVIFSILPFIFQRDIQKTLDTYGAAAELEKLELLEILNISEEQNMLDAKNMRMMFFSSLTIAVILIAANYAVMTRSIARAVE